MNCRAQSYEDFCSSVCTYEVFRDRLLKQNAFVMKLGLENMEKALALENYPHRNHTIVFIAGTNGKGSVGSCLSNILSVKYAPSPQERASGTDEGSLSQRIGTVGFYSTPHIMDFREQFRIDGIPVSEEVVHQLGVELLIKYGGDDVTWLKQMPPSSTKSGVGADATTAEEVPTLTFFEICTLLAAKVFEHYRVEVGLYEIGLGGRLDAVNAMRPANLAILTTMGFDHMMYLGNTIEEITSEKAAIIPPPLGSGQGAERMAIIGAQEYPAAMNVVKKVAQELGTRLVIVEDAADSRHALEASNSCPILPCHISTATTAAKIYFGCTEIQISEGLSHVCWPGRMQAVIYKNCKFILDAAHNKDGMWNLVRHIKEKGEKVGHAVFGCMRDKDIAGMVMELKKLEGIKVHACVIQNNPRAAQSEDYAKLGCMDSVNASSDSGASKNGGFDTVGVLPSELADIVKVLESEPEREQTTLICGSIFLLAEVFEIMGLEAGKITV